MKKYLLIFCIAMALTACSKNDDEPSGGENGGNTGNGGIINSEKVYLQGVLNEITVMINGIAPVKNTSSVVTQWKNKYESFYLNTTTSDLSGYSIETTNWNIPQGYYDFDEIDSCVSEFASFTLESDDSSQWGYDNFGGFVTDILDLQKFDEYTIYYHKDVDNEGTYSKPWSSNFILRFKGNINESPAALAEWRAAHTQYLVSETYNQYGNETTVVWELPVPAYNYTYIIETIWPFIKYDKLGVLDFSLIVQIYQSSNKVIRSFQNSSIS